MMPTDKRRKNIRLPEYDYAQPGFYFVTLCTKDRECLFGEIRDGVMIPNGYGQLVVTCWHGIPNHFYYAALDTFVLMPNHLHALIELLDPKYTPAPMESFSGVAHSRPLPLILNHFKGAVTRRINQLRNTMGAAVWQRNYYEHIVREGATYPIIQRYIVDNPLNWADDEENPIRRGKAE